MDVKRNIKPNISRINTAYIKKHNNSIIAKMKKREKKVETITGVMTKV